VFSHPRRELICVPSFHLGVPFFLWLSRPREPFCSRARVGALPSAGLALLFRSSVQRRAHGYFVISILLQVPICGMVAGEAPVLLLSCRIESLSRCDFLNAPTRCSVKWLLGYKLFFDLIFVIDLACSLTSTVLCFHCSY
jgi:hypothetical protein